MGRTGIVADRCSGLRIWLVHPSGLQCLWFVWPLGSGARVRAGISDWDLQLGTIL